MMNDFSSALTESSFYHSKQRQFTFRSLAENVSVEVVLASLSSLEAGYGTEFSVSVEWPEYRHRIVAVEDAMREIDFPYKFGKFRQRSDKVLSGQHRINLESDRIRLSHYDVSTVDYVTSLDKLVREANFCEFLYEKDYCRAFAIVEPPMFFLFSCYRNGLSIPDTAKLFDRCKLEGKFSDWKRSMVDRTSETNLSTQMIAVFFEFLERGQG